VCARAYVSTYVNISIESVRTRDSEQAAEKGRLTRAEVQNTHNTQINLNKQKLGEP